MADKRKGMGHILMSGAIVLMAVNVVLHSQDRGGPALTAVGATLIVFAVAVLAGARRGGLPS